MSRKPTKSGGNSNKILYWMAAGVGVMLLGIVALVMFMPKPQRGPIPDPERTMLWLYDAGNPGGPAAVGIIEESRSKSTLTAIPFPAPEDARAVFAKEKSRRTQQFLSEKLSRKIHHRVFLPFSVVSKLIDAAGGITVEGKSMDGAQALAFIREGGESGARRAAQVMLGLAEAASTRGVNMSVSEGLTLAGQVDTDLDLMSLPNVLARWTNYQAPRIQTPMQAEYGHLQTLLAPDPVQENGSK